MSFLSSLNQTINIASSAAISSSSSSSSSKLSIYSSLICLYTVLIIFGTLGNSFILYIYLTNVKLRNVRNAFMANLTVSNLVLIIICTPSYLIQFMHRKWIFSDAWCKILNSLQIIIILVSAFSIMAISIDRFMVIVFTRSLSSKETLISVIFIWLLSIALALPTYIKRYTLSLGENFLLLTNFQQNYNFTGVYMSGRGVGGNNRTSRSTIDDGFKSLSNLQDSLNTKYCFEKWEIIEVKRTYILILFCLEFVLPCVCMLVTYTLIIMFLRKQHTKMTHYELLRKRWIQKDKPHQKSCKLLSVLCVTFIVCCLPLSIFNIFAEFEVDTIINIGDDELYLILTILTTFVTINAIANPLLYGWMNLNFRNEIIQYFKSFKQKPKYASYAHQQLGASNSKTKLEL